MINSAADQLLDLVAPGQVVVIAGRPGAGVSTVLAAAASRWASTGNHSVIACWERPARLIHQQAPLDDDVAVFDILGWTIDELERKLHDHNPAPGTLVAVDYLQLINGSADVGTRLHTLVRSLRLRILLGAMATRAVTPLVTKPLPPSQVLRGFANDLLAMRGADPAHVDRLAALVEHHITGGGRRLIVSQRSPNLALINSIVRIA